MTADADLTFAMISYIPTDGSHQGIVCSVATRYDGVAGNAEVAALTASAECPELPDDSILGPPGQDGRPDCQIATIEQRVVCLFHRFTWG